MRNLDEKLAEVELQHHTQSYANKLDFESSEKPSFRINEQSLVFALCTSCCLHIKFDGIFSQSER